MRFIFQSLVAVLVGSLTLLPRAEASADMNEPDQFIELSKQLSSLPIILIGDEGLHAELKSSLDGNLTLVDGSIVDGDSNAVALPSHARFQGFQDIPGAYLVEHVLDGYPVYRIAQVSDALVTVGPASPNQVGPGSLITLSKGHIGMYRSSPGGGALILDVAEVQNGRLVPNERPRMQSIPQGSYVRLGAVSHPTTGENGFALLNIAGTKKVRFFFDHSPPSELVLEGEIQAFSAGDKALIIGLLPTQCGRPVGNPSGLCTPLLFNAPIPSVDGAIGRQALEKLPRLSGTVSGWTYGTNKRIASKSDVQVVGDRVYVIQYRGMTQSLGYFSLSEPIKGKLVLPASEGVELSFAQVNGAIGSQSIMVKRQHVAEPSKFLLIGHDDTVRTIYEAPDQAERAALDLAVKTFPAREEYLLGPMVMVGKRSAIEGKLCASGSALVEVYGGFQEPLRPRSSIGLLPDLLSKGGLYVMASIPGSGGFGVPWAELGATKNAPNQTKSVRATVQLLRQSGCDNITITGFSHGGVVALNALLTDPDMVDNIVIGGTPLDMEAEYKAGVTAVASFLPRGGNHFGPNGEPEPLDSKVFEEISPRALAESAGDLSGAKITILVGENDRLASTYGDETTIAMMRDKGANVTVIERDGVGHTKFANRVQWAEYHAILGSAIRGQ